MFSKDEKRLLGGVAILAACSWWRMFATGSLKVDQSYPPLGVGYAMLAVLTLGWAIAVAGWRGLLEAPPANPRPVAYAALAIAAFMLPMLSNDLFSVMSYGSLAASGHDVYASTGAMPESPFYRFVGERWNETPCMYGPTTLIGALPAGLARGNPWLGLVLVRIAWLVPLVAVMELSLRRVVDRPFFHAMLWLNPLFIVDGPGQLHADLLGLVAVVAAMVLCEAGRLKSSYGLFAVAVLAKYTFLPAGLWFWLRSEAGDEGERGERRAVRLAARLATMAAVFAAIAVVLYAPFWVGAATVFGPLRGLARMNPGGTITEVLGIVIQALRHGSVTPPDLDVQAALALDRALKEQSWRVVQWLVRAVFVVVAARVLPSMLSRRADARTLALGTGVLTVALLTIAGHRFQSWYLPAALPFFGLACTRAWRRWWVAIVAVAVPVEFQCVLERTSAVYPVWGAVTTGAQVIVFVLWFRARYFGHDWGRVDDQRGDGALLGR